MCVWGMDKQDERNGFKPRSWAKFGRASLARRGAARYGTPEANRPYNSFGGGGNGEGRNGFPFFQFLICVPNYARMRRAAGADSKTPRKASKDKSCARTPLGNMRPAELCARAPMRTCPHAFGGEHTIKRRPRRQRRKDKRRGNGGEGSPRPTHKGHRRSQTPKVVAN